ncbi:MULTISPECIES: EYxxD motif small membrane protein [Bacillaceae]
MFWEYVMDMTFVLAAIIGSIVALLFVYIRKTKKGRAR